MQGSASFVGAEVSWLPAPKEVEARAANAAGDGATKGQAVIPFPGSFEGVDDAGAIGIAC